MLFFVILPIPSTLSGLIKQNIIVGSMRIGIEIVKITRSAEFHDHE